MSEHVEVDDSEEECVIRISRQGVGNEIADAVIAFLPDHQTTFVNDE